jgi:hypothetical protein
VLPTRGRGAAGALGVDPVIESGIAGWGAASPLGIAESAGGGGVLESSRGTMLRGIPLPAGTPRSTS